MNNNILVTIILIIVVCAGGFFAGTKYQQNKGFSMTDIQSGDTHMGMSGRSGSERIRPNSNSGMVSGEIIDKTEEIIIVKQTDESTKIILLSKDTGINKTSEGSVDDLKAGETVMIFGQENPDGSISAANIQLNPRLREGFNRMHQSEENQ